MIWGKFARLDAWTKFISIISSAVSNVASIERDHAVSRLVHGCEKTSQLEGSTNDLFYVHLNGGSLQEMHMLSYLSTISHHFFYSPRYLARHVIQRHIQLPGFLMPRRANRSVKKSKAQLKKKHSTTGPQEHSIVYVKDKFFILEQSSRNGVDAIIILI